MSLFVHLRKLLFLFQRAILWEKQVFYTYALIRLYTEFEFVAFSHSFWPVVASTHGTTQWFIFLASILAFFDIVEFVIHTLKILCLDNL